MKTVLTALNARYSHSSLALRYLEKYNSNHNIKILEFSINDHLHSIFSELMEEKGDIYCFSCYIWNIEITLKLAEMIKTAVPHSIIVLGGPEVSYTAKEILSKHPFTDIVISGEGEEALSKMLSHFEQGLSLENMNISGINHRNCPVTFAPIMDLNLIPQPYTKEDLENLKGKIIYFETSRGCPFNCSYCLSSAENGVRPFPDEYVKKGLSLLFENKVPLVKLIDRTFNYNSKRAEEILKFILENSKNTCVHMELEPRILTDEILNILSTAPLGKFQVEMGIQSANPETLKAIGRKYDFEKTVENIKKLMSFGNIHLHLDLIAGLPYEDYESFGKSFDFVYKMRPHMLQLGFLKLLNGTKISGDNNIKSASFPPYEVISTKWLSATDIIKLKSVEDAVETFYNSGAFSKTIKKLTEFSGFSVFEELGEFLDTLQKNGSVKRKDLYPLLYEKYGEEIRNELAEDFIINNKSIPLPEFVRPKRERGFKDAVYNLMKTPEFCLKYQVTPDLTRLRFERMDGKAYMMDYKTNRLFDITKEL